MNKIFTLSFILLMSLVSLAQDFTGQWKGAFTDNSTSFVGFGGERIDYVIELETHGDAVTGYSYTYFTENGKRYYTICKVRGRINRATKDVVVTEYERTKFNTPYNFRNCFQTHKLSYYKDADDAEALEGTWIPAPDQEGDCGFGKTYLSKRTLKKTIPRVNSNKPLKTKPQKDNPYKDLNKESTTSVQPKQKTTIPPVKKQSTVPVEKADKPVAKIEGDKNDTKVITPPDIKTEKIATVPGTKFEKRAKKIIRTIEIESETFTVDLYDNGDIDGDTVSVFYNSQLLLSNQRLSAKALSLKLHVDEERGENELTMYAENLGEIPPNTALMVVKDGDKRYEVRITSDNQKNGTISFVHKTR